MASRALVPRLHAHRVDDGRILWAVHHDHLQHVARCIGTEHEVAERIFSNLFWDLRMPQGMVDIGGVDPVAMSRPEDVHTLVLYYKIWLIGGPGTHHRTQRSRLVLSRPVPRRPIHR